MLSRRRFLFLAANVLLAGPAGAGQRVAVEDWSRGVPGTRGIPPDWEAYETPGGHPAYDFTIVDDDGRRALRLRSKNEHSTIAKALNVDLETTPVLEWSWKVTELPAGSDVRRRETSDLAADVLVIWPKFPALLRSRLIGYAWDAVAPEGTIVKSPKTATVNFVIVRSGRAELGRWLSERRNVAEDYRRIYGETPDKPGVIALSIDSNDTHTTAESFFGSLAFSGA